MGRVSPYNIIKFTWLAMFKSVRGTTWLDVKHLVLSFQSLTSPVAISWNISMTTPMQTPGTNLFGCEGCRWGMISSPWRKSRYHMFQKGRTTSSGPSVSFHTGMLATINSRTSIVDVWMSLWLYRATTVTTTTTTTVFCSVSLFASCLFHCWCLPVLSPPCFCVFFNQCVF